MLPLQTTDTQTIEALRRRDEAAFALLYQAYFPMIERLVLNNSGSSDDARDLFQDTLLILVRQFDKEEWALRASLKTYLYAVAHRQWLARLRKQGRTRPLHDTDELAYVHTLPMLEDPTPEQEVEGWLSRITAHCQRLLRLLFLENQSAADLSDYKNVHTARNQQYKCLQQVRRVAQLRSDK